MGPERDAENPHQESGQRPKLTVAGRLDGHVDGRPVSLIAEDCDLTLDVGNIRNLLRLRRCWRAAVQPLRTFPLRADIRLLARLGWFGKVELFPSPNFLIRMVLPPT